MNHEIHEGSLEDAIGSHARNTCAEHVDLADDMLPPLQRHLHHHSMRLHALKLHSAV